jgi:hypothetical protein
MVRNIRIASSVLGAWRAIVTIGLLAGGVRWRARTGVLLCRVILEFSYLLLITAIVLYSIMALGDLASSLSPKVDFRTAAEIHSDSLIWLSVTLLPIAPGLSVLAVVGQLITSLRR